MTEASIETKGRSGRRTRYAVHEPKEMRPDERFAEIAAILGRGVLRVHVRRATVGGKKPEDFA